MRQKKGWEDRTASVFWGRVQLACGVTWLCEPISGHLPWASLLSNSGCNPPRNARSPVSPKGSSANLQRQDKTRQDSSASSKTTTLELLTVYQKSKFPTGESKTSLSAGELQKPVVMQKYVSCGETWWMRWCFLGRMMWQLCRSSTQRGRPKYVCDHLWIWLVRVAKMTSANK